MREVWDAYTKDRRLIGKICLRGEQGCTGKVIVVYHRDIEIPIPTDNEIYAQIAF